MKRKKAISQSITVFFIAVSFLLYIPLFADVGTITNIVINPPAPTVGANVQVTWDYTTINNDWNSPRVIMVISDTPTLRFANTAGQWLMVDQNYPAIPAPTAQANNGYQVGTSIMIGAHSAGPLNFNLPADLVPGVPYYIIVAMSNNYLGLYNGNIDSVQAQFPSASFILPLPPPSANITKTAEAAIVQPGDLVLFTINYNYINATNFTITDTVPPECTLVSSSTGGVVAGSTITWNTASIPGPQKTGNVWFIASVNTGTPPSTAINNTAHWVMDEIPGGGDSNVASVTTGLPFTLVKSQDSIVPGAGTIGETITYRIDFNSGGMGFNSYSPFDTASDFSLYTTVGSGPGFIWTPDGAGGGVISSSAQGGANYPHLTRNLPVDFCFGEITGDVWIGDSVNKDGLIVFRDNRLSDPLGKAYGLGLSSDGTPANMYLQEVNPPEVTGPPPYRALVNPFTVLSNTWYTIKILVSDPGSGYVRIQAKAWARGSAEPGIWQVDYTDNSGSVPPCGYVGFQGHPTNANMYDNLRILKSNPTSPIVYDTIPAIITYVGGSAGDPAHGPAIFSGGMVSWNINTSLVNMAYSLTWWGEVNYCGDAYNTALYDTLEAGPPVDSNTTSLNVAVCPQTPTITVTWTSSSTPVPSATITPTFTRTVTPTITVTMTPVYYPSISITKVSNINPARPGDTVIYTINYTNTGVIPATNVSILDQLDVDLTYVPGSASAGGTHNAVNPGGQVSWVIPSIDALSGTGTVSFSAVVGTNVVRGDTIPNRVNATCLQSSTPVYSNQHILTLDIPALVLKPVVTVPNPASTQAEIIFNLSVAADVTIKFYTISGELIRTMEPAEVVANLMHGQTNIRGGTGISGNNSVNWDLMNWNWNSKPDTSQVASGIYFYRVEAVSGAGEKAFFISKLVVLR